MLKVVCCVLKVVLSCVEKCVLKVVCCVLKDAC